MAALMPVSLTGSSSSKSVSCCPKEVKTTHHLKSLQITSTLIQKLRPRRSIGGNGMWFPHQARNLERLYIHHVVCLSVRKLWTPYRRSLYFGSLEREIEHRGALPTRHTYNSSRRLPSSQTESCNISFPFRNPIYGLSCMPLAHVCRKCPLSRLRRQPLFLNADFSGPQAGAPGIAMHILEQLPLIRELALVALSANAPFTKFSLRNAQFTSNLAIWSQGSRVFLSHPPVRRAYLLPWPHRTWNKRET
ncbi:hypothetical protein LshimejAT787_0103690 [Lyophyllum shimeji]|uniref:Uncharacterized protein n=1 Tax=Lyophyllum shimeji TaxID=47721 RepID=A0A9P3PCG5_LYOSH|nr:hypothetical protein LshimejAT787_0103690 [Lyophyllum shimeji]